MKAMDVFSMIIQGGAFALLTYIVSVMYPKAVQEARDERDSREKLNREERQLRDTQFKEILQNQQEQFNARNALLTKSIGDQTLTLSQVLYQQTTALTNAITHETQVIRDELHTQTAALTPPEKKDV